MATEYTEHYDLDLYVGEDKPNLRDQYNAAMGKVDDALQGLHEGHADNVEAIASANASIAANATEIGKLQATDATHTSQITALQNGQTSLNTRMGTAEGDIDGLQETTGSMGSDITEMKSKLAALGFQKVDFTARMQYGTDYVTCSANTLTVMKNSVGYFVFGHVDYVSGTAHANNIVAVQLQTNDLNMVNSNSGMGGFLFTQDSTHSTFETVPMFAGLAAVQNKAYINFTTPHYANLAPGNGYKSRAYLSCFIPFVR